MKVSTFVGCDPAKAESTMVVVPVRLVLMLSPSVTSNSSCKVDEEVFFFGIHMLIVLLLLL